MMTPSDLPADLKAEAEELAIESWTDDKRAAA